MLASWLQSNNKNTQGMNYFIKILSLSIIICGILVFPTQGQDTTSTKKVKANINKLKKKITQHDAEFVDKNNDGYNDNAPDHDGDGIPNGLDPDFKNHKKRKTNEELPYVDLNGDGINDNLQIGRRKGRRRMNQSEKGVQPQNENAGSGNRNRNQKGKSKGKK